jgi:hypothetical protein
MGVKGQIPTVVIETDSEELATNKDKKQLSNKMGSRFNNSGMQLLIGDDSFNNLSQNSLNNSKKDDSR